MRSWGEGGKTPSRRGALRVSWIVLLVVAGCLGGPNRGGGTELPPTETETSGHTTATASPTPEQPAALESTLYRLVRAEDRTTFAETHQLELRNGQALVVIELAPSSDLPSEFDIDVRSRHDSQVQAFVSVDDLVPLANQQTVSFVRAARPVETLAGDQ